MPRKVEFAVWLPQAGLEPAALIERAALAEKLGYHSFWIADHMWTPDLPEIGFSECLALLSAIAARTERIRIGTLVICNSFRNPALLAKSLTTIDWISNGRLEAGLGAGWAEEEYRAYGYEFPSMAARLRQLEEGLQILKLMFTKERVNFRGRHYTVANAVNNPKPVQKPHPPITLGGSGEKMMLRLVAQYADRWNCPRGDYLKIDAKLAALRKHCLEVGRDFATITVSEQVVICIGSDRDQVESGWHALEAQWKGSPEHQQFLSTAIKGTPPEVIARLRERVAKGITLFTILFSDFTALGMMELFAREVMPAFALG